MSASGDSAKVIVIALCSNLGIAVAKFAGAFYSGSASMLAEAIHSLVDCTNQVLLLVGNKASKRAPTTKHPLGFGREAFFWSFIVAILLFSMGGMFAIYEGVHKLHEHGEVSYPMLGLGILFVSIVLEGYSFHACLQEVRAQNTHGSLWKWFRDSTSSELLVIFMEDLAAMAGLVLAFLALLVAWLTGDSTWDAAGSIVVGTLLVIVAVLLGREIKSLLIGEAPSKDYRKFLDENVGERIPGGRVLRLIALQTGASDVMLSFKVHPGDVKAVADLVDRINAMEKDVKTRFPEVRWLFVEPDFEA